MDEILIPVCKLFTWTAQIKWLLHSLNGSHKACFKFFGKLYIFNGSVQTIELLLRRAIEEISTIEIAEHLTENIQLIFDYGNWLFDTFKFFALKVGVLFQSQVHILLDTDIIHNQSLVLAFIDTVDTGNGLNKCVLLNGLVNIDCVKARHVKAGEPHIDNDSDFEIGLDVLKLTVKLFAVILWAEHFKQFGSIVLIASHNHLDFFNRF